MHFYIYILKFVYSPIIYFMNKTQSLEESLMNRVLVIIFNVLPCSYCMLKIHLHKTEICISKIKHISIMAGKKRKKKPQTNVSCITLEKCQFEAQIT